jgi:hypothetical protein
MIKLNLLSASAKNNIQHRKLYSILRNLSITLVVLCFACSSLLFGARYMLYQLMEEINTHTGMIAQNSQGYNSRVKEINQKLELTEALQSENTRWTCLLNDIFADAGDFLFFRSVAMNENDMSLSISGHADTRDALLAYKTNLEKREFIESLNLPLQNLLIKENFDFTITAKLDKDYMTEN